MRQLRPEMCFLVSTGQNDEVRLQDFEPLAVAGFLMKPYDTRHLPETVHAALGHPLKGA
ncbi:MAG: hypothetical protein ACR2NX_15995 [Chthoniobacterales bacterium]